jgi:hypothetical protein
MNWGDVAQWAACGLALLALGDRIFGRFMGRKFATIDELSGVERVLSDRCNDQEKALIEVRGELRALPNSRQMEEIREDVGELKVVQGRTEERLEGIGKDVHHMRQMLERAVGTGGRP